jgi:acetyl esterase/lipase
MKQILIIVLLYLSVSCLSQKKEMIYLWPGKVPGEMKEKQPSVIDTARKDDVLRYAEVTNPALEVWPADPKTNNSAAVIVCPGGAYRILAWDKEGTEIAAWLNTLGYSAFVLQYRVPEKKEGALQDAQRALRVVRQNAARWKIDPDKVGIMGFSAGGSLSARTSTLFFKKTYSPVDAADSLSCRPAFAMLIYPAYLDQGENRSLTPELQLTKETPPVFIFQTADDSYGNSALVMASALRDAKLPVELHILPSGGHGYGLRPVGIAATAWPKLAEEWLKRTLKPNNQ